MALVEVVTRTYRRPGLLQRNIASLMRQSDDDWQQVFLVDTVGLGVGASYQRMAHHQPLGEWVWVLDDDDECIHPGLVADVRRIAGEGPEVRVIMVRMDHGGGLGILPDDLVWGKAPILGHVGVSSYIVRRDVWMWHAHAFGSGRYASDFDFIAAVFDAEAQGRRGAQREGPFVVWHDVVASKCMVRGQGRSEAELAVTT